MPATRLRSKARVFFSHKNRFNLKKVWKRISLSLSFRRRYVARSGRRNKRHGWRADVAVFPSSPSAASAWAFSLRLQIIAFSSPEIGKRRWRWRWRKEWRSRRDSGWEMGSRLTELAAFVQWTTLSVTILTRRLWECELNLNWVGDTIVLGWSRSKNKRNQSLFAPRLSRHLVIPLHVTLPHLPPGRRGSPMG